MEPQEKLATQQFIIDRLHDIQKKVEANNYTNALASIKEVKASDAKNIYLIALEKQIAKLSETSLPVENRTEIIKSLPSMIDRAISDVQRRASAPKVDEAQKGQKEAALEKLKSQYFQRADDYVEKQEYQRALEEIRRIYIIEPGSVVAKEYEQKIEQLAALHARGEAQTAPTVEAIGVEKSLSVAESTKEKIVLEKETGKSKLPLIAVAAVVILAVGAWFFFSRSSNGTQAKQELVQQPSISQESVKPTSASTPTPEPQSTKNETVAVTETSKPSVKTQTERPVTKSATPEQKPAQSNVKPVAKAPVTTQQQPPVQQAQQQTQQQATLPIVNNPSPQTAAKQEVKTAESTPAAPMPFVAVETQPVIVRKAPPKYPEIAIKMGIQGNVYVEVTIDAQGKPIQAKVLRSASEVFNDAAIEAAMKSTYKPGMMSTGPVTSKMTVPFIFSIKR